MRPVANFMPLDSDYRNFCTSLLLELFYGLNDNGFGMGTASFGRWPCAAAHRHEIVFRTGYEIRFLQLRSEILQNRREKHMCHWSRYTSRAIASSNIGKVCRQLLAN
jgi:hypothetical protein